MKIIRQLLFPFAILFGLVTSLRNFLFDIGFFKSCTYSIPSVGVGNLAMGGTGKSVVIEYLTNLLKDKHRVAILSRGYKRKTRGFILADDNSTASVIGDEPFQFFKNHPEAIVAVSERRKTGMNKLMNISPNPEVILLDDVLQHRWVKPRLMILTTSYDNLYVEDSLFPVGFLREKKRGARRANLVLITKCPAEMSLEQQSLIRERLKLSPLQTIFFTTIIYDKKLIGKSTTMDVKALRAEEFLLVTGIANPRPLVEHLEKMELKFKSIHFPDHYKFDSRSVNRIEKKSKNKIIVTTEKDFGRVLPVINSKKVFYLPIKMEFVNPFDQSLFENKIKSFFKI